MRPKNGNDAVEITIADNGTGIESGQEDIIFEPFFTTRADGTGLGLAIVKQTIEEHRGQITVENRIDSGAQFYITSFHSPISNKLSLSIGAKSACGFYFHR